jgi:hypothetical protein
MLNSFEVNLSRRRFLEMPLAAAAAQRIASPFPRDASLIVMVVVEQLRADYLDRFRESFGQNGLRRLMSEGAYYPECCVESSTFPSSSLATLATGSFPDMHGVIADRWFDSRSGAVIEAGRDHLLAPGVAEHVPGRSLALGHLPQLTALLASAPNLAFTLQPGSENEVNLPVWLTNSRVAHSLDKYKGSNWMALHSEATTPPLRVLSEDPARPQEFQSLYRSSPFAQTAVLDLLRAMVSEEKTALGEETTFVSVLLTATSTLGYETGGDSPLMRDLLMHLDVEIENTLAFLDKIPGAGAYSFILTGAHGVPPVAAGKRKSISSQEIATAVNQALSTEFSAQGTRPRYVERYIYPFLYLRREVLTASRVDPGLIRRRAGEAALRVPGVSAFYTADGFCSRGPDWTALFRNSFHATRSGDLMLAYAPEYVEAYGERGISYGSLYNYETRVPLIFFGRAFRSHAAESPCRLVDVAPTVAHLMGSPPPAAAVGRVLYDSFAPDQPAAQK